MKAKQEKQKRINDLQKAIRDAAAKMSSGLDEKDALNAMLDVADEWRCRLEELEAE